MSGAPLLMLLLLGGSAVFSSAEAALFTLAGRPDSALPALARRLLRDPVGSLTLILLGNLVVNLAYFSAAAFWAAGLAPVTWPGGVDGSVVIGALAVAGIVLAGEILPKIVAHRIPVTVSGFVLPPVWLLHELLGRPARWLGQSLVGNTPRADALDSERVHALIESEGGEVLGAEEQALLRHVLELGRLRAGALRRPLAETLRVPAQEPLERARAAILASGESWAAVTQADGSIRGSLDLTRKLAGETAGDAMRPVPVLPELAPVAQGITLVRDSGAPFVLLVDEYGESAGIIERGRWADTLLDKLPQQPAGKLPAVVPLGGGRFQVDASLALHDFKDRFGDPGESDVRVDTLAGLVQERLGKVPRVGDRVRLGGFYQGVDLIVMRCHGARVMELEVRPLGGNDGTPYTHPPAGSE